MTMDQGRQCVRRRGKLHCHPNEEDLQMDKDGFVERVLPVKGRAVFTNKSVHHGEFLLIYHGNLISAKEGNRREQTEETGFRYFFNSKDQKLCVDATEEPPAGHPSLGRLVNHGGKKDQNCKMKVIELMGKPRLCLFAMVDIPENTELLYDYGLTSGFQFPPPYYTSWSTTSGPSSYANNHNGGECSKTRTAESRNISRESQETFEQEANFSSKSKDNCNSADIITNHEGNVTPNRRENHGSSSERETCGEEEIQLQVEAEPGLNKTKNGKNHHEETVPESSFSAVSTNISRESQGTFEQEANFLSKSKDDCNSADIITDHEGNVTPNRRVNHGSSSERETCGEEEIQNLQVEAEPGLKKTKNGKNYHEETVPESSFSAVSTNISMESQGTFEQEANFSSKSKDDCNSADIITDHEGNVTPNRRENHGSSSERESCGEEEIQNLQVEAEPGLNKTKNGKNHHEETVPESSFSEMSDVIPHRVDNRVRKKVNSQMNHTNIAQETLIVMNNREFASVDRESIYDENTTSKCSPSRKSNNEIPDEEVELISTSENSSKGVEIPPEGSAKKALRDKKSAFNFEIWKHSRRTLGKHYTKKQQKISKSKKVAKIFEEISSTSLSSSSESPPAKRTCKKVSKCRQLIKHGKQRKRMRKKESGKCGKFKARDVSSEHREVESSYAEAKSSRGVHPKSIKGNRIRKELTLFERKKFEDTLDISSDHEATDKLSESSEDASLHAEVQPSRCKSQGSKKGKRARKEPVRLRQKAAVKSANFAPMMSKSNDLEATANSSESSAEMQPSRFKSRESSKGKMIRKKLEQFKRKAAVKNMKSPNRLGESSNLKVSDESCESSGDYSSYAEMQPSKGVSCEHSKDKGMKKTDRYSKGKTAVKNKKPVDSDIESTDLSSESSEDESSNWGVQTVNMCNDKRVWDKKDCCFFCGKLDFKIARHWFIWHKDELQVKKIENIPKLTKERTQKIAELRNKGNLKHNLNVWATGKGQIVPRKRPSCNENSSHYLPCEFCSGSFTRKWLSMHQKKCSKKHGREMQRRVQSAAKMMIPEVAANQQISESLRIKVLSRMISDEISLEVKKDSDILIYGSRLLRNHPEEHQALLVSQRMRDMAKLVIAARERDSSITGIRQCIDNAKFDTVVASVRAVAGYSSQLESYEIPSYARNIGFEIDKVIDQLCSEALKSSDNSLADKVKNFKDIKLASWSHEVTNVAHHTLKKRKRNRPNLIPVAEDLKKLSNYLKSYGSACEETLRKGPVETKNWQELCQATLASVSLFNKRRSGETERLLLEDYKKGRDQNEDVPQEVFESFSELEKALVLKLHRIEVRGKRDRTVAILLTTEMVSRIDLLNETREEAGVNTTENPYVFARAYFGSPFAAKVSECYQKFSKACGAENPESIRSTKLRKHIAIMSQLLCLKENELDLLAGYMGHDIRIHREFYRLTENTLQLAKVSKLLIMMERGIASDYKGKSLEEIDFAFDESDDAGDNDEEDDNDTIIAHDDRDQNEKEEEMHAIDTEEEGDLVIEKDKEETQVTSMVDSSEASRQDVHEKPQTVTFMADSSCTPDIPKKPQPGKRKLQRNYASRKPWKPEEKKCVLAFFKDTIYSGTTPNRAMCKLAKEECEILQDRSWSQIKDFVVAERKRTLKKVQNKE